VVVAEKPHFHVLKYVWGRRHASRDVILHIYAQVYTEPVSTDGGMGVTTHGYVKITGIFLIIIVCENALPRLFDILLFRFVIPFKLPDT
jgi:hypothetical protein